MPPEETIHHTNKLQGRTASAPSCYLATNSTLIYDAEVPEWINISPKGAAIVGRDGRKFKNPRPARILEWFKDNKGDVVVDINHSNEIKAPKGEESPAVGFVKEMAIRDGSVWGRVEWNARGEEAVRRKDYRYVSPTFLATRDDSTVAGIRSVALTNVPNLYLPALNSWAGEEALNMDLEKLAKILATDPTEISVTAALNALVAKRDELTAQLNAAKEEIPSIEKFMPRADYDAMAARAAEAEAKLAEMQKAAHDTEVNSVLDEAKRAGKIVPATVEHYRAMCASPGGLGAFKEFMKVTPALGNNTTLDTRAVPQPNAQLSQEELDVCRLTGVTTEQFLAAGKL